MEIWFNHFFSLLLQNNDEVVLNFDGYNKYFEELDKDFTIHELRDAIFYHLKLHKASGPDGISNGVIKWGMEWFQHIILLLFNQLWRKEVYQASWYDLFLIPIFKNGSLHDNNNNRGIAVMNCLGKPFTVLVNTRIYSWVEKHSKISPWQSGF